MTGLKYARTSSSSEYLGGGSWGTRDLALWKEENCKLLVSHFASKDILSECTHGLLPFGERIFWRTRLLFGR